LPFNLRTIPKDNKGCKVVYKTLKTLHPQHKLGIDTIVMT